MKVQTAENGWPGIFIPGDEALGWATSMEMMATALESNGRAEAGFAIGLRRWAKELQVCRVSDKPSG